MTDLVSNFVERRRQLRYKGRGKHRVEQFPLTLVLSTPDGCKTISMVNDAEEADEGSSVHAVG
jgi:hypothetical protein